MLWVREQGCVSRSRTLQNSAHSSSICEGPGLLPYHIHDGFAYLNEHHEARANTVEKLVCKERRSVREEEGNEGAGKGRGETGELRDPGCRKPL